MRAVISPAPSRCCAAMSPTTTPQKRAPRSRRITCWESCWKDRAGKKKRPLNFRPLSISPHNTGRRGMRWRVFPDKITSFRTIHQHRAGEKMKLHARVIVVAAWIVALPAALFAQDSPASQEKPLAFRTAIELALKNSATTGLAHADLQRARATVTQTRDVFLPQMVPGSGLGGSYGFPLSLEGAAPSIFNLNFQGALVNGREGSYVKAARSDVAVTAAKNADRRNEVITETALDYVQLDLLESSLAIQREQQESAAKFQDIVNQRVQAGLDSQVETTRAKLVGARTTLDIAQTRAAADQLRLRLSQLTG